MKKHDLGVLILALIYLVVRFHLIFPMNEYMDYDEGTYLLIARFINHGYLPYRNIYAVHPPLYYYLLAMWLRVFGDNYIVGRTLSLFLGLLSILVAYLIGKELRGWKLGLLFSGLLTLDPLMIHMNTVVYHETSIEFFTLLSMYYFVRLFKTGKLRYAYASLFIAAVGSTSKFTILPYLLALYLTILFFRRDELWKYMTNAANVILSGRQGVVILMAYIAMVLVAVSAIMLYPSELTRLLIIVPGITEITIVGQKFAVAIMLILWGVLTVYVFNVSYVRKLVKTVTLLLAEWKTALAFGLVVLVGKLIVELPLGILVSRNYMDQTYLAQGTRYSPVINLFTLVNNVLMSLSTKKPEFLYSYIPLFLLILIYLLVSVKKQVKLRTPLKNLTLMGFLIYFFVAPVLPNLRFLYPLVLVVYTLLLDGICSVEWDPKKATALLMVSLVVLGAVDYGMVVNFPRGKLELGWAIHSKELRDDLGKYISRNELGNETYYSINPMNVYYLNLNEPPFALDNFGIFYLAHLNSTYLLHRLIERGVSQIIFSTWMYVIKDRDATLKRNYDSLLEKARRDFVLEFAESYSDGEVVELYKIDNLSANIGVTSSKGEVALIINGTKVAGMYVVGNGTPFNLKTKVYLENGSYVVKQWSENESFTYVIQPFGNELMFHLSGNTSLVLEFRRDVVLVKTPDGEKIMSPGFALRIRGAERVRQTGDNRVEVRGEIIVMSSA